MTKIEPIPLRNYSNNEHFCFMSDFDQLITNHPATIWGMDVLYGVFQNTLMAEDLALRIEQGSLVSETLEIQNHLRDKTWNAIQLRVKSTLLSPYNDEVNSAREIERIILLYGDVCSMTYQEQSTALANFSNDLLQPVNAVHLDRLGVTDWVIALKNQNEEFMSLFNQRNSEFAGRESGDVKAVRTLIDPVFNKLIEKINATLVLEIAHPEVRKFVGKLNEKIKYYKIIIAAHNNLSKMTVRSKQEV